MTAKSNNQRQAELTERRKAQGLKQVRNLWVNVEDEAAVKAFALKLNARREREARRAEKAAEK